MRFRPAKLLIPLQATAAIVALLTLAMWPPPSGEMLLVPMAGGDTAAMAKIALASGAVMLGSGPLPGSLVVIGDRARIAQIRPWSLIIMAAPPAGCGAGRARDAAA